MEEFKSLNELMEMDRKHKLMGGVTGSLPSLERMHKYLASEVLNEEVPDEIKGQFNVAKNMAIYSYFFYALAPEVHLKTYTIIEHALRLRVKSNKRMMLKALINHAVSQRWISDAGFRHFLDLNDNRHTWYSLKSQLLISFKLSHNPPRSTQWETSISN